MITLEDVIRNWIVCVLNDSITYSGLQKDLEQSGDTKFLYFLDFPKLLFRDYYRFILTRLSTKKIRTFD